MTLVATVLSCGNSKIKNNTENPVVLNLIKRATNSVTETPKLYEKGVLGKWECSFTGFKSIIYLIKQDNGVYAKSNAHLAHLQAPTHRLIN